MGLKSKMEPGCAFQSDVYYYCDFFTSLQSHEMIKVVNLLSHVGFQSGVLNICI